MKTFENILLVVFWLAVVALAVFITLGIWDVVGSINTWRAVATLVMVLIVSFVSMLTIRLVRK